PRRIAGNASSWSRCRVQTLTDIQNDFCPPLTDSTGGNGDNRESKNNSVPTRNLPPPPQGTSGAMDQERGIERNGPPLPSPLLPWGRRGSGRAAGKHMGYTFAWYQGNPVC